MTLPMERIATRILVIRGHRVMFDADLAALYGVETKNLIKAAKRNPGRFAEDFMFQLSEEEWNNLRFQNGTSSFGRQNAPLKHGGRYVPYVFTEHGALKSARAEEISRMIVRAFVWLRQAAPAYKEIAAKVTELENAVGKHDDAIKTIVQTLQQLIVPMTLCSA